MFDTRICVHKAWKWRKKSLSAGYGENSSSLDDYYNYYENHAFTTVPISDDMKTLTQAFLPILYSSVFIFSLIGRWDQKTGLLLKIWISNQVRLSVSHILMRCPEDSWTNRCVSQTERKSYYYDNASHIKCIICGTIFYSTGNGLVVCVIVNQREQRNLTDICLFNLALSDLLFIVILPFFTHYSVVQEWPFGNFMCHFTAVLYHSGFFSNIFFLVIVTVDRYLVILHSQLAAQYHKIKLGITLTVVVWMLSLFVSMPAIIFTKVTNESYGYGCVFKPENDAWKYYDLFANIILGLVIPLFMMVVCYSRIIPTLVKMKSVKRRRVIKLLISIVVIFFLCWAPYNICSALFILKWDGTKTKSFQTALTVTETFAYTHCCLNPIIYAFMSQRFMKNAKQLMRKWIPGLRRSSFRTFSETSFRRSSNVSRSSAVLN